MKSVRAKENRSILKTLDRTQIFKIAKKCGVDLANRSLVCKFIKEFAPTKEIYEAAYLISNPHNCNKNYPKYNETPIIRAIQYAKFQKKSGQSTYSKKLVIGHTNIYWASPNYGHADYNKSIAFENTEKNRCVASVINRYLGY